MLKTIENINRQNALENVRDSGLSFIEQLQISASNRCTKDNRPYLIGVNENVKVCLLTKPACKCWNCEACAANNTRKWIAKIINGCNKVDASWSFFTLTAHEKQRREKSVGNLRSGWKKVYNRILSKTGKNAENLYFSKIWEQTRDGTFHLHLLINLCLGTRWGKDNARSCGLGYQAEWHEVDNIGMVAGYIAKYSLKNASISRGGVIWPRGLRRIETSRNWPKLPDLRSSEAWGWIIKMSRDEQIASAQRYFDRGFDTLDQTGESMF